jgi:CNT family concentrative nucleoside transporter
MRILCFLIFVLLAAPHVAHAQSTATATVSASQQPSLLEARRAMSEEPVDWPGRARSFVGLLVMIGLAWLMSNDKKRIDWRLVVVGTVLQLVLGVITLSPPGQWLFSHFNDAVQNVLRYTATGSSFLFGNLALSNNVAIGEAVLPGGAAKMGPVLPETPMRWAPIGAYFAFGVLPTIIFFSSFMAVLYHLGVMQRVVRAVAVVMQKTMRTSGAETLSAAGNIFVGQTEAPLLIRPFVKDMTVSELMAVMTGGFATVAGGVMVAYVGMLVGVFPDIAGHLLCASIMSAPAALVMAKIIIPEPDRTASKTFGKFSLEIPKTDTNVIDAAARGASEGLQLALNVGAMLLAFIALIAMVNGMIGWFGAHVGMGELSLERILGWVLAPLAWIMGVTWNDAGAIGTLLGIKTILNEFVAYGQLSQIATSLESKRSMVIATYALCGFSNLGSIGIQLGGIGPLAPERRGDLARIGFRAMIAGSLACFMTACVIGLMT